MGTIVVRVVGGLFALIEAALLIRLVLPFIEKVPRGMRGLVPPLISVTDALMAPFEGFVEPFDLSRIVRLPGAVDSVLQAYVDTVDAAVIVAMIGWAIVGMLTLFVLRLVVRAR